MNYHVIKENNLFFLGNENGEVPSPKENSFGYGLFLQDTRTLSQFSMQSEPRCLRPLSADSSQNFSAIFRYTNTAFLTSSKAEIPSESILFTRNQMTSEYEFLEEGVLENFSALPLQFQFIYEIGADFADMFQVRNFSDLSAARNNINRLLSSNKVQFSYTAKDNILCETTVKALGKENTSIQISPSGISNAIFTVTVSVAPHSMEKWVFQVCPRIAMNRDITRSSHTHSENVLERLEKAQSKAKRSYENWYQHAPVVTGSARFVRWYNRGLQDLRMLITDIGFGSFPVAGVPWYSVPFGRDSLITALQSISANTQLVRGTLRTMAAHQGKELNPTRDEQPGKIMHELRTGELTRIGDMPFDPYYGTIDATPLFLNLAADYWTWTADLALIKELLPNIEHAFDWIDTYGDRDGDGYVEYLREAERGIANQGWKDSGDSIMHKDGRLAKGSVALCEVQGYVFRAYSAWADIYQRLGDLRRSRDIQQKADNLKKQFERDFWIQDDQIIALALDGEKRQVKTKASNMGQVLWSGILSDRVANQVIDSLLEKDINSGFGIRTLSTREIAFNPISYHNGSVWPHDNSMIIAGMAKYGRKDAVSQLALELMRASEGFSLQRLPELFAGISSDEVPSPVPYPVSCSPQAWAAASPILILQSLLGLYPDTPSQIVSLDPCLPPELTRLKVENLKIGNGELSIAVQRNDDNTFSTKIIKDTTGLQIRVKSIREVTH